MSTISKLDPRVRAARTRRANTVRDLHIMANDPGRSPTSRLAIASIAAELDRVRKYPARTGAEKEARFRVVVNREKFQSPVV